MILLTIPIGHRQNTVVSEKKMIKDYLLCIFFPNDEKEAYLHEAIFSKGY
jgi:hypothetical protein